MRRLHFTVYAASLVLFGLLGYLVHRFGNFPGDGIVSLWLEGVSLPFMDTLLPAVSYLGNTIPAVVTVAVVASGLWFYRRRLEAVFIILLPSLAALISWLLKMLIDRPRPGGELLGGLSFPSGHVTYAVVFFGFVFYLLPGLIRQPKVVLVLRSFLLLLIILTVASRVYLGAHWFSDVLGGLLLGGLILAPAITLYNDYAQKRRRRLESKSA